MKNNFKNKIEVLSELIQKSKNYTFDGFELDINIKDSLIDETKRNLNHNQIKYEESLDSNILINLRKSQIGIKIFFDRNYFLKDFNLNTLNEDFAILVYEKTYIIYLHLEKTFLTAFSTKKSNKLVENTVSYLRLKERFAKIADYQNTANNEMVFYSSSRGIFKLKYPNISPHFGMEINRKVEDLISKLESSDFKIFLVNEFFDFLKGSKNHMKDLIINIESIVSSAERNHQLYLKNFSFDEFRNQLQYEKSKYFENIREILGKVLNQLISIPISVSAVVFTVYRIEDIFLLSIVFLGYLAYLFFFIKFQLIYYFDIQEISKDFQKDFKKISINSGLPKEDINPEKKKIQRRISNLKMIIIFLIILISLLSLCLSIFIFKKINAILVLHVFRMFFEFIFPLHITF